MKKILYIAVCALLFCSACSDSDIEPNPSRQAKRHITLTFSPGQARTRTAADESRIDDINLYLFPASGGPAPMACLIRWPCSAMRPGAC